MGSVDRGEGGVDVIPAMRGSPDYSVDAATAGFALPSLSRFESVAPRSVAAACFHCGK